MTELDEISLRRELRAAGKTSGEIAEEITRRNGESLIASLGDITTAILNCHPEAERLRDLAIGAGKAAIMSAIQCGELLLRAKDLADERGPGEFSAWIEIQSESLENFPSRATCFRYMKAVKFKETLGDEFPDFANLKELYVAADILPPPATSTPGSNSDSKPLYRIKFQAEMPPEKWTALDRREFIERAKEVVKIYERCVELEAA